MTAVVSPERALVGALLLLPVADGRRLLGVVRDDDPADPRLRTVLAAVRELVADDVRPDPVAVHARLRAEGRVTTAGLAGLAVLLAELTSVESVPVPLAARAYARAVVEESVRRRVTEAADRLRQVADNGGTESLVRVVAGELSDAVAAVSRLADPSVLGGAAA